MAMMGIYFLSEEEERKVEKERESVSEKWGKQRGSKKDKEKPNVCFDPFFPFFFFFLKWNSYSYYYCFVDLLTPNTIIKTLQKSQPKTAW